MNKDKLNVDKLINAILRDIAIIHLADIGVMPRNRVTSYPNTILYVMDYDFEELVRAIKSLELEDDLEKYILNIFKSCQKDIDKIDNSIHFN